MKKTTSILGALAIAAALTAGFTACTSDDNIIGNEQQPAAVKTYTVTIPATMPSDEQTRAVSFDGTTSTSTFASTERVYVYNVTKDEMMGGYLQPSNITTDGKSCNLTGTLSGGTIEAGDELKLMYNLTNVYFDPTACSFYYNHQNGTQAGVLDGAKADVTASGDFSGGVLTTTAAASFQPVQSMFRFKFVDENNNPINVKNIAINSAKIALATYYYPLRDAGSPYVTDILLFALASATTDYVYVALCIDESQSNGDVLSFIVRDNADHFYEGTKAAPTGGFVNGKYYYNTEAIQLTKTDYIQPTLTGTSATPDENYMYDIYNNNITISGKSRGYRFWCNGGVTNVTIDNLDAFYSSDRKTRDFLDFATSSTTNTLNIVGTNTINSKGSDQAIFADGPLKLSGNGTLTVTATSDSRCGLYGTSNYTNSNNLHNTTTEVDVSAQLAADGYTVTRSARTDNSDGSYTWTYTVTPTN